MKKLERAKYIVRKLEEIYPQTPIPLNSRSNFQMLIAVLLSDFQTASFLPDTKLILISFA